MVADGPRCSPPAPKTLVKNLGFRLDQALSLKEHAAQTAGSCCHTLGLLRRVFPLLPNAFRKTLMQALILSRLDYCNGLLVSANASSLHRLQLVQNTAARLVLNAPPGLLPVLSSPSCTGSQYMSGLSSKPAVLCTKPSITLAPLTLPRNSRRIRPAGPFAREPKLYLWSREFGKPGWARKRSYLGPIY